MFEQRIYCLKCLLIESGDVTFVDWKIQCPEKGSFRTGTGPEFPQNEEYEVVSDSVSDLSIL